MINETGFRSRGGTDVERRQHLAPPACAVCSAVGKLWPHPTPSVIPGLDHPTHLLSPGDGARREGPAWPRRTRLGGDIPRIPILAESLPDKRLFAKGNFQFATLCALPLRRGFASLPGCWADGRRGTFRQECGQQPAYVPISEDGLAPRRSSTFSVPAEYRQLVYLFENELPTSWQALPACT